MGVKDLEVELTPKGSKKTTSHLQKLSAKPMEIKERVATDFFGRAIKIDPAKLLKKKENEIVKSDIWFKFKEGYSNEHKDKNGSSASSRSPASCSWRPAQSSTR